MLIVCMHLLCFMMHILIYINIKIMQVFMNIRTKGDVYAELGILQCDKNWVYAFPEF